MGGWRERGEQLHPLVWSEGAWCPKSVPFPPRRRSHRYVALIGRPHRNSQSREGVRPHRAKVYSAAFHTLSRRLPHRPCQDRGGKRTFSLSSLWQNIVCARRTEDIIVCCCCCGPEKFCRLNSITKTERVFWKIKVLVLWKNKMCEFWQIKQWLSSALARII